MTSPPHPLQDGSLDPLALLRRSRGDNDPRDTKLRLLWLRQREPEARVRTKLISLDEHAVVGDQVRELVHELRGVEAGAEVEDAGVEKLEAIFQIHIVDVRDRAEVVLVQLREPAAPDVGVPVLHAGQLLDVLLRRAQARDLLMCGGDRCPPLRTNASGRTADPC